MLVCAFSTLFARETAGAARTRLSLRPHSQGAKNSSNGPGAICAAGSRRCIWTSLLFEIRIRDEASGVVAQHPPLSSPAKAGDPVLRDVGDGIERPRRTG